MLRGTRLKKELQMLVEDAPDFAHLRPDDDNTLLWNYLIEGPPGSVYEGGWYWGVLKLPENYPLAPPSILMMTPSGRFETNTRICMSMSDFHPESWQPAWWLSSLMKGLVSFMIDKELTTGAIMPAPSDKQKRKFASTSLEWARARPEVQAAFPDLDEIVQAARAARPPPDWPALLAAEEAKPVAAAEPADTAPPDEKAEAPSESTGGAAAAAADVAEAPAAAAPEAAPEEAPAAPAEAAAAAAPTAAPAASTPEDVDNDPRPFAPNDLVRVKVCDPNTMPPEERPFMGREGVVKKGARPGCVLVLLRRPGESGVNMYFREEQLERLKRTGNNMGGGKK